MFFSLFGKVRGPVRSPLPRARDAGFHHGGFDGLVYGARAYEKPIKTQRESMDPLIWGFSGKMVGIPPTISMGLFSLLKRNITWGVKWGYQKSKETPILVPGNWLDDIFSLETKKTA